MRRFTSILWAIIGAGVAIRIAIAFSTYGDGPDMRMLTYVGRALLEDPLHVYETLNHAPDARWFYPSGYFPWLDRSRASRPHGAAVPRPRAAGPIAADAAIAWIVQNELGRRGRGDGFRLAAAAAVAFGPRSDHLRLPGAAGLGGDPVRVLGLVAWDRAGPRRALTAGLLVGLGGAIKAFPLLLVLALLPTARSRARW